MPRYDSSMTEERVVEMRIDNDNFEKGAKETISTLEKLEKALKIKGDSSAIDDMSKAVNRFDASPMVDSFDTAVKSISNKASFLQGIFQELGRDIYNFGKQTVKGLVVDPISQGFDKYTSRIETTQTLLAATEDWFADQGITDVTERLEKINEYMDKLMWYTDETSYSFSALGNAMSKFASVGVPLDQALTAMMGFSNWAASAGVKPDQASHALEYAIVQAMGTGYMGLGDFKTLESMNMATKEWKENVLEMAADMELLSRVAKDGTDDFNDYYSTIVDPKRFVDVDGIKYITDLTEKEEAAMFNWINMRGSLNEKWFTSDLLTQVLARYGEFTEKLYELSQATGTTVPEAKELLRDYREHFEDIDWDVVADKLKVTTDELMRMLENLDNVEWKISEEGFYMAQEYKTWQDVLDATRDAVSTQWMKTFDHIFGNFLEAKELWTEVGELFYDMFVNWLTLQNDILEFWHLKGGREALLGVEEQADGFRGALWNIVDAIREASSPIKEAFAEVFGFADKNFDETLGQKLIDLTQRFREWTKELGFSEEALNSIKSVWKSIFGVVKTVLSLLGKGLTLIGKIYTSILQPLIDFALKVIGAIIEPANEFFTSLLDIGEQLGVFDLLGKAIDLVGNAIQSILPQTVTLESILSSIKNIIDAILGRGPDFEEIKNQLVEMSKGGGVDLTNRPIIDAKILKDAGWEEAGEGAATVFSSTFSNAAGTLAANFTPIIVDENGNYVGVLSPQELAEYAEGVIEGVREDDLHLQIGAMFEGDDAVNQAVDAANTVHELHEQYFLTDGRKIIELFGTVKEVLSNAFSKAKEKLVELVPELADFFAMFEGVSFTDMINSIKTSFSNFVEYASEKFGPAIEKIKEFIETAKPAFEQLGTALGTLWTKLKEGTTFKDVIDTIAYAFSDFGKAISEWFEPIKQAIGEKFDNFINWLNELKPKLSEAWQSIIDLILSFFNQDSDIITRSNPMMQESWFNSLFSWLPESIQNGLATIITIVQGAINNFKTTLMTILDGQWAKGLFSNFISMLWATGGFEAGLGIANIGKGFNNVAKALKKFSNITKLLNSKAFKKSIKGLASDIGGFFDSLSSAFEGGFKIQKITKKVDTIGTTLLKIAGSIAILVASMYVISKMETKDIFKALQTLLVLASGLFGVSLLFKLLKFNATPVLQMAISLGILLAALWVVSKFPAETLISGLGGIAAILLELAVFSRIAASKNEFYAPFIKLAVALWILMKPLKTIAEMDIGSMIQGLIGLGVVMLEFGVLSRMANTGVKTGGFIAMSIAVGILSYVASKIGEMDVGQLLQGVIGLGAVILEFKGLVKSANGMGKTGGFIPMAIAVGILSYTMSKLGAMDLWSAMKGVRMLGVVIKSLSKVIESAKGFTFVEGLVSLLFIAGLLLELWYAFNYINGLNVDFARVLAFSTSIAEICLGFGYMIKNAKAVSFSSAAATLGEFVGFLGVFAGLLTAFTIVKRKMDEEDYEKLINDIMSVSNMLGRVIGELFGGFIAGFGHGIFGDALDGVGDVIQELVARFKEFVSGGFDLEAFGTKLSNFMTNVQGFITGAKEIDPSVGDNVGALSKAILAITGSEFLTHLLDSLGKIDSIEEFSEDVPKIGKTLQDFSTSFNGIQKVDDTVLDNVDSLGKAITKISGAEFRKSIGEFLTIGQTLTDESGNKINSIDKFKTDVVKLGDALVAFAGSISGMPEGSAEDIKIATGLATGLATLNDSLPAAGGTWQNIVGMKDLGDFSADFETLGTNLKYYSIAIKGISTSGNVATEQDRKTANELATDLAAFANSLPSDKGWIQSIFGYKDLGDFSTDLETLGTNLKAYSRAIKDISKEGAADEADIDRAIYIAEGLSKLQKHISGVDGVWQWLSGTKDLADFGTKSKSFGESLVQYAQSISGLASSANDEDLTAALTIAENINEFSKKLDETGGFVQEITGYKDLETFSTNLETLGASLKAYADSISGIAEVDPNAALTIINGIQTFIEGLKKSGGFVGFFKLIGEGITGTKDKTLTDILTTMTDFGMKFQTFANSIASAPEALTNFEAAASLIRSFKQLQDESGDITDSTIINEEDLANLTAIASQIPQAMAEGIISNISAYNNALNNMLNEGYSVFNYAEQNMYTIGMNLDTGLANGIYANASAPINAMAEVANAVVETAANATEVASPSRVFMRIGDYLDQGLSLGISQNASEPVGSIETLGDNLITAMQDAMMQVSTIANGQFDFQPQITPVVDLSNVRAGASEYTRLFGGSIYSSMNGSIARNMSAAQSAQSAYNNMLQNTPQGNTSPDSGITVNVYANEGQSEQSIADAVVNLISAKSIRRSVAFG